MLSSKRFSVIATVTLICFSLSFGLPAYAQEATSESGPALVSCQVVYEGHLVLMLLSSPSQTLFIRGRPPQATGVSLWAGAQRLSTRKGEAVPGAVRSDHAASSTGASAPLAVGPSTTSCIDSRLK